MLVTETSRSASPALLGSAVILLAHLANSQQHLATLPPQAFRHLAKVGGLQGLPSCCGAGDRACCLRPLLGATPARRPACQYRALQYRVTRRELPACAGCHVVAPGTRLCLPACLPCLPAMPACLPACLPCLVAYPKLHPRPCSCPRPSLPCCQVAGLVDHLSALSAKGCRIEALLVLLVRAAAEQLPAHPHYEALLQALLSRSQMGEPAAGLRLPAVVINADALHRLPLPAPPLPACRQQGGWRGAGRVHAHARRTAPAAKRCCKGGGGVETE